MSECEKMECIYYYKDINEGYRYCHFNEWWTPPCEEDDYEEKQ